MKDPPPVHSNTLRIHPPLVIINILVGCTYKRYDESSVGKILHFAIPLLYIAVTFYPTTILNKCI